MIRKHLATQDLSASAFSGHLPGTNPEGCPLGNGPERRDIVHDISESTHLCAWMNFNPAPLSKPLTAL